MFRVGSWLYGKKPAANASTQSLDSLVELRDLEDAMRGMSELPYPPAHSSRALGLCDL